MKKWKQIGILWVLFGLLSGCTSPVVRSSASAAESTPAPVSVTTEKPAETPKSGIQRVFAENATGKLLWVPAKDMASAIRTGIDVSSFQGEIDWSQVKAAGYTFAFVRIGGRGYETGVLYEDSTAIQNITDAQNVGLDVGIYFYSQAITVGEAIREANYAIQAVRGAALGLPIMMDLEYYGNGKGRLKEAELSKAEQTAICEVFCETVEAAGYTAGLYSNYYLFENIVDLQALSAKYPIWCAQYGKTNTLSVLPAYWQYSAEGAVPGISVQVDADIRVFNLPEATAGAILQKKQTALTLSWEKLPGVAGYILQRWSETLGDYETVATLSGAGTCDYEDKGLQADTAYVYRVCGYLMDAGIMKQGTWSTLISGKTTA